MPRGRHDDLAERGQQSAGRDRSHRPELVTNAARILFFALASLPTANDITVRQIAAGLAAGVPLDAVVVRMLLRPALVSPFGNAN